MRSHDHRKAAYALGALTLSGVIAAVIAVPLVTAGSRGYQAVQRSAKGTSPSSFALDPRANEYCSRTSSFGAVARLRTGQSIHEVRAAGYAAEALITTGSGAPSRGAEGLIFVPNGGAGASPGFLSRLFAVTAVGTIDAQSARSSLHSCMYDLSDKPQAVALARAAETAAIAAGYLSNDSAVVMSLVSDDPTSSGDVFVTLAVGGAVTTSEPGPLGGPLHQLRAIVALEDLAGTVRSVGFGPWYSG